MTHYRNRGGTVTTIAVIVFILSKAAVNFAKAYERIKKANQLG